MSPEERQAIVLALVGTRYVPRGRGPDAFDCWGLYAEGTRRIFGREVPDDDIDPADLRAVARAFTRHPARAGFASLGAPPAIFEAPDGAAVMLSRGDVPFHIGLWLRPERRVLHCCPSQNTVLESIAHLRASFWRIREVLVPAP